MTKRARDYTADGDTMLNKASDVVGGGGIFRHSDRPQHPVTSRKSSGPSAPNVNPSASSMQASSREKMDMPMGGGVSAEMADGDNVHAHGKVNLRGTNDRLDFDNVKRTKREKG